MFLQRFRLLSRGRKFVDIEDENELILKYLKFCICVRSIPKFYFLDKAFDFDLAKISPSFRDQSATPMTTGSPAFQSSDSNHVVQLAMYRALPNPRFYLLSMCVSRIAKLFRIIALKAPFFKTG